MKHFLIYRNTCNQLCKRMMTLVLFGIKVFFGRLYFDFLALHGNTQAHASSKYLSCVDCMSKFHTI